MNSENTLTSKIIFHAIEVHKALGPGLLERVYKECLYHKLLMAKIHVEKEKHLPIQFEGMNFESGYRIDLLVENKIVVELKSVENLSDLHLAQTLTYLKLGDFRVGLLLNFNVTALKHGIKRVVNDYID